VNVDTGDLTEVLRQLAALNRRVTAQTGQITTLTRQLESVTRAEQIIRRAHFGYPVLGADPPASDGPRRVRPRHLRSIK
jgi:hypothetical protein